MPLPCSATTTAATILQSPSSVSTTTAYTTIGSKIAYHKVVMCSCEPFSSIATSSPSTETERPLYVDVQVSNAIYKKLVNVGEKKSGVASYYGHRYNQGQEARLLFSDQCHPGSTYILRRYSIGFNGSYHIPFGGLRVLDNNDFMFFNPNHPTPCCRLQGNHSRF
ncbi:hypothetical protein L2E82_16270 [Cichorium intybus]|uniref:Uncharacterized protein n=1 Tax=Cichorium intybus TaxID=13427 RepID=A0ACB9F616_CICIN|nr:hypothetical protein L2E82_16270 [Cichorium intybus]